MSSVATDHTFKSTLTRERVEWGYRKCLEARDNRDQGAADCGYRLALARDPKLLLALEAMAEQTGKMQEEQIGRLMRSPDVTFGESRGTTEHQLCREAYRLCDEGRAIRSFEWLYACAAILCSYWR